MVGCCPLYLPQKLSVIIIIAALYVAPSANATEAMEMVHNIISMQQTAHSDTFFIAAGDYNQASLKTVLPKFHQHVNFTSRRSNMLDLVYKHPRLIQSRTPGSHWQL